MPGGDTPQSVEKSWNQGCSFDRLGFRWIAFPLREKTNSSPPKIGLKSPPKGKDHLRSTKIYFKKYMTSNKLWDTTKSGKVFFLRASLVFHQRSKHKKKSRETIKLGWKKHLHVVENLPTYHPRLSSWIPTKKSTMCFFYYPKDLFVRRFLGKERRSASLGHSSRPPVSDAWLTYILCCFCVFCSNTFLYFFWLWKIWLMIFSGK